MLATPLASMHGAAEDSFASSKLDGRSFDDELCNGHLEGTALLHRLVFITP